MLIFPPRIPTFLGASLAFFFVNGMAIGGAWEHMILDTNAAVHLQDL